MNDTRLDIAYLHCKLCRFINNLDVDHWNVINKVLKYLRYILHYELH